MLIGESNVAIDPAIGGYGVADIYLGEFSPHSPLPGTQAGSSANLLLKSTSPRIHGPQAGVGARSSCGNGLFPLINLPNFILASLS